MKPTFFETPAKFRAWLQKHHQTASELWVGYYRKQAGKRSITYHESLDEALCFGWIDGIRKSVDADSYMNRFTPRKPKSMWSAINTERVEKLMAEGKMTWMSTTPPPSPPEVAIAWLSELEVTVREELSAPTDTLPLRMALVSAPSSTVAFTVGLTVANVLKPAI